MWRPVALVPSFPVPSALVAPLLLALVLASDLAGASETPLRARLSPGASAGELVFSLVNTADEPIGVLRAGTPLEPTLSEDVLEVTRPSKVHPPFERARYTGRLVKRAPPGPDDVVTLGPGESLATTLRPAEHYAIPDGDDYRVRFTGEIRQVDAGTAANGTTSRARPRFAPRAVRPPANTLELALEPDLEASSRARPPTFAACDADQQRGIVEATLAAEGLANEALASLRGLPETARPSSPRYLRWFGAHEPARYTTVTDGYARILDSLAGATLNFDCSCQEGGVYAFVRPILLHDVNLCPLFFASPVLGTDSQAGTLVHELSHFTALVGTGDTVYSQDAATALAARDPALAIDNADNFEYFAENTPSLPMAADGAPPTGPSVEVPADDGTGAFVPLVDGVERRGSLATEEVDRYTVTDVDVVGIVSEGGDADLYVYDDPALDEAALICRATGDGSESPVDFCELPAGSRTWYVTVVGFSATDYRIVARTLDLPETASPTVATVPASGVVEGELARGAIVAYRANGPLRVELSSLSGDADLLVFAGDRATARSELCRSVLDGGVDSCDLSVEGEILIVVAGYSDATFRLETLVLPGEPADGTDGAEPPDDDPVPFPPTGVVTGPVDFPLTDSGTGTDVDGSLETPSGGTDGGGGSGRIDGWSLLAGILLAGFAGRRARGTASSTEAADVHRLRSAASSGAVR